MLNRPVRLNMNEMPYPPPQSVMEAAENGLARLNRYCGAEEVEKLRALLSDYCEVPAGHIIPGPGSDILLREFVYNFSKGRKVVMVSPSFLPTVQAAKQTATRLVRIRLSQPGFDLDFEALAGETDGSSLVIIDNPNNPTGKLLLDSARMKELLFDSGALFIIDEAYYEFSGITFAEMVEDHPNLAVTRTMDKSFSLAGLRIGYVIAGGRFLEKLPPLHALLPRPTVYAALRALTEPAYAARNIIKVKEERERVKSSLERMGVRTYSSSSNFLMINTEKPDIAERLLEAGIIVRNLSARLPAGFIRVTIGLPEENDAFLAEMTKLIA